MVGYTGSTQTDLTQIIREQGALNGTVLVTEYQTEGRGRLDRSFIAPPGTALLFSLFVTPKDTKAEWGWLPLLAGQAVCAAMDSLIGSRVSAHPKMKWPNDILINDKKVAGLLSERIDTKDGPGVVIGVGINVYATQDELPIPGATSLTLEGLGGLERDDLLVTILEHLGAHLERWESGDPKLLEEYLNRSATIGHKVEVELPGGVKLESDAVGIDPSGALVLADGRHITVGDVVHLYTK